MLPLAFAFCSQLLLQRILLGLQLVDLALLLSDLHVAQVEVVVDLVLEGLDLRLDVTDLLLDIGWSSLGSRLSLGCLCYGGGLLGGDWLRLSRRWGACWHPRGLVAKGEGALGWVRVDGLPLTQPWLGDLLGAKAALRRGAEGDGTLRWIRPGGSAQWLRLFGLFILRLLNWLRPRLLLLELLLLLLLLERRGLRLCFCLRFLRGLLGGSLLLQLPQPLLLCPFSLLSLLLGLLRQLNSAALERRLLFLVFLVLRGGPRLDLVVGALNVLVR